MTIGIYCCKCLKNGKVYVGQSIDCETRWKGHISALNCGKKSGKWQSDWNRFGADAFEWSILQIAELPPHYSNETEEMKKKLIGWELDKLEKFWISKLSATSKKLGYNKAPGGSWMPKNVKKKWMKKKNKQKL